MEIKFMWWNNLSILWDNNLDIDIKNNNLFINFDEAKKDNLVDWFFYEKIWNKSYLIKYFDKKIIILNEEYLLNFETKIDAIFVDIINNKINIESLLFFKSRFIIPIWFFDRFHYKEYLTNFSREIMLNNISTPKVIKVWQYIIL